ncbi:MAG: iron ABC transporter permease, partial [Lachnospiraceae bacterium]|nr:iron ABC transporter permease [Lachnospiraceae bacterium]
MQDKKRSRRLLFCGGILACLLITAGSLCLGSIHFSPAQLVRLLMGGGDRIGRSILLYARLPRTLAALFSGAALAVSGAVLQNVLDNRLASPGIIGVNA